MQIALDYDGTYTADKELWDAFIELAQKRGHDVVCVTMRHPTEPIAMPVPVIYTSRKAKHSFAPSAIWIDDKPGWIFHDA
jgi:hypothetical protein